MGAAKNHFLSLGSVESTPRRNTGKKQNQKRQQILHGMLNRY